MDLTRRVFSRSLPRMTRDGALFLAGLMLTINEAVLREGPERPYMLLMFSGMMGLPAFLYKDESKAKGGGDSS